MCQVYICCYIVTDNCCTFGAAASLQSCTPEVWGWRWPSTAEWQQAWTAWEGVWVQLPSLLLGEDGNGGCSHFLLWFHGWGIVHWGTQCGLCFHTTAGEQILVFVLWLLECADMKDRIIAWVYYKLLIVPYIKKNCYFLLVTRFQKARKY